MWIRRYDDDACENTEISRINEIEFDLKLFASSILNHSKLVLWIYDETDAVNYWTWTTGVLWKKVPRHINYLPYIEEAGWKYILSHKNFTGLRSRFEDSGFGIYFQRKCFFVSPKPLLHSKSICVNILSRLLRTEHMCPAYGFLDRRCCCIACISVCIVFGRRRVGHFLTFIINV